RAVYVLPDTTSVADTLVAWSITWLLVSTRPLGEMTMPVPSAVALLYFSCEVTSTMPGSTLLASACALSEPAPALLPPVPALLPPCPFWPPLPPNPLPPPLPPNPLLPLLKGFCWMPPPPGLVLVGADALLGVLDVWLSAMAAPAPAPAASAATAT